jgi:hypothetical protein
MRRFPLTRIYRTSGRVRLSSMGAAVIKFDKITASFQLLGATLAVPTGAVGLYSAYHNYFSAEVACHTLRDETLATLDKKIPLEVKRNLLRNDVAQFDAKCATIEPEANVVFQAAVRDLEKPPAPSRIASASPPPAAPVHHTKVARASAAAMMAPAAASAPHAASDGAASEQAAAPAQASDTDAAAAPMPPVRGWVAVENREAGKLRSVYFTGYAPAQSLPEPGTVLTAMTLRGIYSEPQEGTRNSLAMLQGRVAAGECVRVVSNSPRTSTGRQWVEVDPAKCP